MAMTSLTQVRDVVHAPPHAGEHESHAVDRLTLHRLGLWLFILSESCLFIAFIASRYYLQGLHRPAELNQLLGLGISGVLLLSSLSAYRAEVASEHGDIKTFGRNMLATLALGGIFVLGVGFEW